MGYLSGFHAIEERLRAGGSRGPLLVAKIGPRARELVALATEHRIPIHRVGTHELDRIASDHRGIVLQVEDLPGKGDLSLEGFIAGLGDRKDALVAVLDEITDPHNYGAILRSCDQFAVDLVLTRRRRIAKHAEVIARTSAGAVSWVSAVETPNLSRALRDLKDAGFWIYGADMAGEPVYTKDLTGRLAFILGGEGGGISRLLRDACDGFVSIPAKGRLDSLNVSVAAGVIFYEALRQRAR
ncbi:MAG: 23S rRNA (guanosine(2251)-2'-O)-methyltransferase RlmB [Spirochaetaceae bacterium]|jgi:23S rRNA (guanosine2251-2'-O)-methyltransferase|nr:23S rRNA (guanosine(2251)-2'-O)-methyltransferase RlmB [Spirochaetaceae bacterium]